MHWQRTWHYCAPRQPPPRVSSQYADMPRTSRRLQMRTTLILLALLSIATGCSHRAVYENAQLNAQHDCSKVPPSQYDACIERASKSHDRYDRERRELGGA
jgi:hypothetical protein